MNLTGYYIKITKRNAQPNLQPQAVKEGDILNPKRFEWKAYTDVKCLVQDLTSIESERIIQRMTTELSEACLQGNTPPPHQGVGYDDERGVVRKLNTAEYEH